MKMLARLVAIAFLATASASLWAAAPPTWVNFQGRLLDSSGVPVTQSGMAFQAALWSDPTSTVSTYLKYKESHTVDVDDGVYSFPIGSGTPISGSYSPSLYANNNVLWLEITVNGETLSPRHRLLSAPYTNHSGNSENLGGQPITYFGTAAADASLQNQINGLQDQVNQLPGNSGLQSLCVATGNIWDVDKAECVKGGKVINFEGKIVPVEQDGIELASPDLQKECDKKHYRAILGIPVVDCDSNPVEVPTSPYGCGLGAASSATLVGPKECAWMQAAPPPKG